MFLLPGGSEQAVINAINAANTNLPFPITNDDLYFGKMKLVGTDGTVSIPAVTVHSSRFEGYVRFEYKRLDLSKVYGSIKPKVKRIGYPTLYRLLPIINEVLGLSLTEDDVVDVNITWLNDDEQINIPIVAKTQSPVFEGQFLLEYTRLRPNLADLVYKTLTVLQHPIDPALNTKSLSMAMWSTDFSAEYATGAFNLRVGRWWDIGRTRAALAPHGFPNWPQAPAASIGIQSTKLVPTANQDFAFVIVQKNVILEDHRGDGYIHFNR